jgi:hypothetical protein
VVIGEVNTSASIDWGSPINVYPGIHPGNAYVMKNSITKIGTNKFAIFMATSPVNGTATGQEGWFVITGSATNRVPHISTVSGSVMADRTAWRAVYLGSNKVGGVYLDSSISPDELRGVYMEIESTAASGVGGVKALGLALGGNGATLYGTYSDDTNLNLNVYDTSDMSLTRNVSMGVGTTNDTASKIRLAYPETIDGNDNFCYVYGRMLNPGGLSASMNHIIKTEDAGVTFSNVENTWGRDHCGAMARRSWATPVVIRNIGNSIGGFYVGGSGLTLRSLLPFPVSPGGLYVTNNGFVIAGASTAETWPIRYTIWPYQRWARLKDYPTDGGVTGITVL